MTRRLMCFVCSEISFGDCLDKDVQVSPGALGVIKLAFLRNLTMPRCLGRFALRWMECILGHESVQQTVLFFLNNAALVITTVAVMKLC